VPYPFTDEQKAHIAQIVSELEPLTDDDLDAIADVLARIRLRSAVEDDE